MRQLPLGLGPADPCSFDNFHALGNEAVVAHLRALANAPVASAPVYLWGARGTGKTHLLRAWTEAVSAPGGRVGWFDATTPLPWEHDEDWRGVVFDGVHAFDAGRQHAAFVLFAQATAMGQQVVAAGAVPPVDLAVREDLRSRLGWGPVFQLQALPEEHCRAALRREADRRGIFLSDEVMSYLMTRFERDLGSLMSLLDRLDRFALAQQRGVTIPLLKRMLAEEAL
ncbi:MULTISPECIES: DnaA regulatory inactivator Hda [Caldimonas]|uniref:DnaA regulatory inactivator Hda n=1 Tax=Caldimonas TaxID=196013 RepID=UPI00036155C5|nr:MULTISPECIES: DnaA regulatory inactivator Hda [Caldimonas]MCX7660507.1 DnaA regulatory inactivator Hda [Caldimonas manganoxidans]GIX24337.1 MAG: DnaA regulatory inactivator Hda [Caldimonas sp.]